MVQKIDNPLRVFLKANFFAGLFVALPLGLTIWMTILGWRYLELFLLKVAKFVQLERYVALEGLTVPLMALIFLIIAVLILGVIVRNFVGRALFGFLESIVSKVPLIGLLYVSLKQLAEAFISAEGKTNFKEAVLVQFPMEGSWVIGFLTGSASEQLASTMSAPFTEEAAQAGRPRPDIVTVFVPTTPLPSQGFTLVLPRSETRALPISVPDAIKLVISGGIITRKSGERQLMEPLKDLRTFPLPGKETLDRNGAGDAKEDAASESVGGQADS